MAANRTFTMALALSALAAGCVAGYRRSHSRRLMARPRAQPRTLQTWEGEGGALPVGGSRSAAQTDAPTASGTGGEAARAVAPGANGAPPLPGSAGAGSTALEGANRRVQGEA